MKRTKRQNPGRSFLGNCNRATPAHKVVTTPLKPNGAPATAKDPKSNPGGMTQAGTISKCANKPS